MLTLYEDPLSNYAIRAEGLSKQFVIGARQQSYHTLREALTSVVIAPFHRLRKRDRGQRSKDTVWALNNVDFNINRGEVVGVIGRNGAGKSTLLKILSRITAPTRGRVSVRGRVASLLEVGTGFHPELTGRENIFLNGAILGMTRSEVRQRFEDIVSFADVDRFIDTPVKHYSSGMYMRLAFAIAAHLETDILLVDEVLAVGDASFQQKCLAKMEDVAGHGRTVIFVSHNMTAVQSLCQRVIYLENGEIRGDGDPKTEIQEYLAASTGSPERRTHVEVGESITIQSFSFAPNPVDSGRDLRFKMDIKASAPLRLSEAAIIINALEGSRVGIVDLRDAGFPIAMEAGDALEVETIIRSLPLVDRQYRISLYINSGAFVGIVSDLADLTVAPAPLARSYSQYPPEYRGWVELKVESSSLLHRKSSLIQAVM